MVDDLFQKLFRRRKRLIQAAAAAAAARLFGEGARLNQERWSAVSTYWEETGQA